jgi:hypothetical protein
MKKMKDYLNQKICHIPDPEKITPDPDPEGKKAPDPGSGTLIQVVLIQKKPSRVFHKYRQGTGSVYNKR